MARFYTKAWFPYVLPFLLCFTLEQSEGYLPNWALHIAAAKILIGGGLIWVWRERFSADIGGKITAQQLILSIIFGIISFALWYLSQHFQYISLPPNNIPPQWPAALKVTIGTILIVGSCLIMPIISELFWRSLMLRYLIVQDFQSIPLGKFQLFSFLGVVFLAAIPSEYFVAVAAVGVMQNILIIWQKNLRCCIVASAVTNVLLALYLLSNNYQLM
ncbi:MAG: CAAX prenyl protease-related protein [Desulfuromonas sp.]|nr:CAAX prenyl protease-related protein [Desulfuromonas sp.]